jgi:DNA polymerase
MASQIYDTPIDSISAEQRFIGKTTVLGAGYGMGADKFQKQLANMGKSVDLDMCKRIIKAYRTGNPAISGWWLHLNSVLVALISGVEREVDRENLMFTTPFTGIGLPNGLYLNYPELTRTSGGEFTYLTRNGRNKIYGGKVAENICQAVARCIIGEQMINIEKRYRVVLTVHDAIAGVVPIDEADEARNYIEQCMRTPPKWAVGLPLNCESGMAQNYGDC